MNYLLPYLNYELLKTAANAAQLLPISTQITILHQACKVGFYISKKSIELIKSATSNPEEIVLECEKEDDFILINKY